MPANILNLPAYAITAVQENDHDYHKVVKPKFERRAANFEIPDEARIMQRCASIDLMEVIEGDLTTPSGFAVRLRGREHRFVSDESESLLDEAKEIAYRSGRPFWNVLAEQLRWWLPEHGVCLDE